ncbi:thioester dehydrase family protein [Gallaecimonas xiamenensis 3-C-1]|uniref:Thioester dehydrase family protein n=2 Tax=Gallaecimonas TaxID=745410 RepID=K2JN54_9GAMM|nr:thioester dehydrase family protein [Gallaecimonas xiamenensis 3-C-1]
MLPLPPVLERRLDGDALILTLDMVPELAHFQGHFPGNPILPGVAQLDWAARFGAAHFGLSLACKRLEGVKFQALVLPGQVLTLTLCYDAAKGRLHFHFASPRGVHSSGKLALAREAA